MSHASLEWKLKTQDRWYWRHPLLVVLWSDDFLAVIVRRDCQVSPISPKLSDVGTLSGMDVACVGVDDSFVLAGWVWVSVPNSFFKVRGKKIRFCLRGCREHNSDFWLLVFCGFNISWPCLVAPPPLSVPCLSFVLFPQDLALWCS